MNQRKSCNPIQRVIAILLSVCLIISAIPAAAFADDEGVQKDSAASGSTQNTDATAGNEEIVYLEPEDVTEDEAILSESGEDYTTFDLGGKKRYSIFFTENVRFKDEDGDLTDYDPAYIELDSALLAQSEGEQDRSGYLYRNTAGDSYQYIPEALSEETPILLEKDDYQITIAPTEKTYKDFFGKQVKVKKEKEKTEDAYGKVKKKNIKAAYKDETALAYVEYISLNTGIKENIVLTKRPAKNTLQFEIRAPGLRAEVSEADGSIGFYDKKTEELINQILPPNMNDATDKAYSEDLAYTIEEKEDETDTYILTLTIDKKYLQAKERQYPVTIDPTDTWANTSSGESLWDAYVYSGSASTNYYASARQTMPVGKGSGGIYRTYINFLSLKSVINGTLVDSAELSVYENADSYSGSENDPNTLHLYAYCANNPVNYVDPSGHDAIVLESNFVHKKIGHMAVLIQKRKNWVYFSWDNRAHKNPEIGKLANTQKGTSVKGKQVYDYVNKRYSRNKDNKKYKRYIYIEGDFTGSLAYINKVKQGESYKYYSLTTINCVWMALEVLQHGGISSKQNKKIEVMQWKKVRNKRTKKFVSVPKTIIPNTAFSKLQSIFGSKIQYVK